MKEIENMMEQLFREYIPKKLNDCRIEWVSVYTHSEVWKKTECKLRIAMYGRYGKRDDRTWVFEVNAKDGDPRTIVNDKIKNSLKECLFEYLALANRAML